MNKSLLTILSFSLIILLGFYLYNFRAEIFLPVWIFWLCILGIFSLIIYQIFNLEEYDSNHHILIITQILLAAALVRILFISPDNVLIGYDSYNELINLYKFNILGYWNIDLLNSGTSNYPIIYVYGLIFSKLLNVDLFSIVKWFPLTIYYMGPLFIYLIGNLLYTKKAALFSMLGFSFIYISLFFHSAFQRETIALILMLINIYIYFRYMSQKNNNIIFLILSILMMITLILAHHLTSFIYLVFLSILLFTSFISKNEKLSKYIINEKFSIYYVLLLFTMIFGYWIYLKYTPLEVFGLIIQESAITDPGTGIVLPINLRYTILYYSEIIFSIIFGTLSLIALFIMRKKRRVTDVGLFFFSIFTGVLMVITLFGALLQSEGMGLGSRMQTFVYIGLFFLSGYLFDTLLTKKYKFNKKKLIFWIKRIIPLILLIFLIINIYRIPPYLYSESTVFQQGEARSIITIEELTASEWLGMGRGDVIADNSLNGGLQLSNYLNEQGLSYGIVNDNNLKILYSKITPYSTIGNVTNDSNEIYDNGIASIFLRKNI